MRRKTFASFVLVACVVASLLSKESVETVLAKEAGTNTEAMECLQKEVTDEQVTTEADFEWDGTKIIKCKKSFGTIVIPHTCTEIGNLAFDDGHYDSIVISDNVKIIAKNAFRNCSTDYISVVDGNTEYDSREECNAIIESGTNKLLYGGNYATVPNGVTTIAEGAFEYYDTVHHSPKSIKIPASVTNIEDNAFQSCGFDTIEVEKENQVYDSRNSNVLMETRTNRLILGSNSAVIPEETTEIGAWAFSGCSKMMKSSITIPGNVKKIGEQAFEGCTSLEEVIILDGCKKIDAPVFSYCRNIRKLVIPKSVVEITNSYLGIDVDIPGSIYGYAGSYAETYAKQYGYPFEVITEPTPEVVADVTTSYRTHVQSFGWQNPVTNGVMSGTSGKAKRLEGIEISVSGNKNLGIQYSTHCQTYGWLPWSANGEMNGTTGEAKRLEAIKIQLTGADKDEYDVYYRVHAQSYGWLGWAKNGEPSGTAGYAKRLEGIQIVVVKKDGKNTSKAPGLDYAGVSASKGVHDSRAYIAKTNGTITIPGSTDSTNIMYKTHVQSFGWQNWVLNGTMSGTSGKAKRLEGINIKLSNAAYAGGIQYRTHVQTYGWEKEWRKDGAMSGTSGKAKRLEAIQIKLYGEMANRFDVYYRVHAQSYGWLGWAKNGEESGTAGYAKRLEGIQIVLVPKGGTAPANNYKNIQSVNTKAYIMK